MKVFVTISTFVVLAAAESQIYPNRVEFYPSQDASANGFEYFYYHSPYPYFTPYLQEYATASSYDPYRYRGLSKREAESSHAKSYSVRMSNPNGGFYEYNVQVDHDGQGHSYQHQQQVDHDQVGTRVINHGQSGYNQQAYAATNPRKTLRVQVKQHGKMDQYKGDQSHQQTPGFDQDAGQVNTDPYVRYSPLQNAPNKDGKLDHFSMDYYNRENMADNFASIGIEAQPRKYSGYGSDHEKHQPQIYRANTHGYDVINQRPILRPAMAMVSSNYHGLARSMMRRPMVNSRFQQQSYQFQPLAYFGNGKHVMATPEYEPSTLRAGTYEKPKIHGFEVNAGKYDNQPNHATETNHNQPMTGLPYQIIEMA